MIDIQYLQWHPEFIAHGSFQIKIPNTKIFATDEHDKPVAVAVKHGIGQAFFTTLDPDFHYITGSFIRESSSKHDTQERQQEKSNS